MISIPGVTLRGGAGPGDLGRNRHGITEGLAGAEVGAGEVSAVT
jgi:hypothetical protein